jgi:hypothetical protein
VITVLERDGLAVPSPGGEGEVTVRWRHLLSAAVDTHDNRPHNLVVLLAWLHRPRIDACLFPGATVAFFHLGPLFDRVKALCDQILGL